MKIVKNDYCCKKRTMDFGENFEIRMRFSGLNAENSQDAGIHTDIMTDTSAHYKQVKNFM